MAWGLVANPDPPAGVPRPGRPPVQDWSQALQDLSLLVDLNVTTADAPIRDEETQCIRFVDGNLLVAEVRLVTSNRDVVVVRQLPNATPAFVAGVGPDPHAVSRCPVDLKAGVEPDLEAVSFAVVVPTRDLGCAMRSGDPVRAPDVAEATEPAAPHESFRRSAFPGSRGRYHYNPPRPIRDAVRHLADRALLIGAKANESLAILIGTHEKNSVAGGGRDHGVAHPRSLMGLVKRTDLRAGCSRRSRLDGSSRASPRAEAPRRAATRECLSPARH